MFKSASILLAAVALSACTLETTSLAPSAPMPTPTRLHETPWQLAVINGRQVEDALVVDMSGNFISGEAPCNHINGNYLGTGPILRFETIVTTRATCDRIDLEREIIDGLLAARSGEITNGVLTIRDESGTDLMTLVPARV
ncbi:MAG: META domain-containing protein [Rubricella sp.]